MSTGALRRSLGLVDATALVIGCTIGVGIFRAAASVANQLHTAGLVMLAWAAGGLLSFCGALCYAELGAAYPKAGGDYVYVTKTYGPAVGFLFGWTKVFIERIGTIAVLGYVFSEYLSYVLGYGPLETKLWACVAIALLTAANIAGIHVGKGVQNFLTALKLAAILGIVAAGLLSGKGTAMPAQVFWSGPVDLNVWKSFGVALVFVIWTYGGWAESTYVAEELHEPEQTLPWSIFWGLLVVTVVYLVVNGVYLMYVPLPEMPARKLVAAEVMKIIFGPVGAKVTALMVVASALGALNGYILTSSRVLMAMGRDHGLFKRLAHIHPDFHTPAWALVLNGLGAIALVWAGTFDQIVTYSTVAISVFYVMVAFSVILLRKREPHARRPYKVWGYPLTPWLFIFAMILFIVDVAIMQPREAVFGFGLLVLGLPLYGWSQALSRKKP